MANVAWPHLRSSHFVTSVQIVADTFYSTSTKSTSPWCSPWPGCSVPQQRACCGRHPIDPRPPQLPCSWGQLRHKHHHHHHHHQFVKFYDNSQFMLSQSVFNPQFFPSVFSFKFKLISFAVRVHAPGGDVCNLCRSHPRCRPPGTHKPVSDQHK